MLDPVIYSTETNGSKSYPVLIDTFRVVIISRKKAFPFSKTVLSNTYSLYAFVLYILLSYLGRKLILEDRSTPSFCELALSVLYESTGQTIQQHHQFYFLNVARIFYHFFIYVTSIYGVAVMTVQMASGGFGPQISKLSSIRDSNIEVVFVNAFHREYPGLFDLVEDRLGTPNEMSVLEIKVKFVTDCSTFAVAINDRSIRVFRDFQLPERMIYVVPESFGKSLITQHKYKSNDNLVFWTISGLLFSALIFNPDSMFTNRVDTLLFRLKEIGLSMTQDGWVSTKNMLMFFTEMNTDDFTIISFDSFFTIILSYFIVLVFIFCFGFIGELMHCHWQKKRPKGTLWNILNRK